MFANLTTEIRPLLFFVLAFTAACPPIEEEEPEGPPIELPPDEPDAGPPPPEECEGPTAGEPCGAGLDECCDSVCVNYPDEGPWCAAECAADSHCASGCCVPLTGGGMACAPSHYCEAPPTCGDAGDQCGAGYDPCCAGATCVNYNEGVYCGANCTYGSDCQSGCCVGLESDGAVCAPSSYCG